MLITAGSVGDLYRCAPPIAAVSARYPISRTSDRRRDARIARSAHRGSGDEEAKAEVGRFEMEKLAIAFGPRRRSFTPEHVDLSLVAEEATETLRPLAEKRGLTIETSGDMTATIGSHALLLQLSTNLVHNA
ncbi:MAG: hypothetical protein ACRDVG_09655, partial [Jatrophihabitantaceae bacterium]